MTISIIIVVLSCLASLITFPVSGSFRITLGIVVLFAGIHAYKIKKPILLSAITGLAVCLTRIIVESFGKGMTGAIASNYLLEITFYVGYGIIYYYAITKNTSKYPLPLVAALTLGDAGGNFIEYYLRHLAADEAWLNTSLTTIFLAAVVRSTLIVILVWLISRFVIKDTANEGRREYD